VEGLRLKGLRFEGKVDDAHPASFVWGQARMWSSVSLMRCGQLAPQVDPTMDYAILQNFGNKYWIDWGMFWSGSSPDVGLGGDGDSVVGKREGRVRCSAKP
jgi:hypothetical protein